MTDTLILVLLVIAVVVELACAVGVVLMDNALDRLHFIAPATIIPPLAIALASWVRHGADQSSIKATLALLFLIITGPVLSHITARSMVARSERK